MPADVEEDSVPRREADADADADDHKEKRPERDLSGNKDDAMNSLACVCLSEINPL